MLTEHLYTSSAVDAKRERYIPALTGLRAVAAYLVFLHHYNPAPADTFANRLFAQGYIGVSVFFVLSGFLIHHRYADDYFTQTSWSWRTYLQNRFARILPLYVLVLMATICVNTATGKLMSWPLVGLNVTLFNGFFEEYKFSGIAQSWSLTVEVCFYLSAPFLFVLIRHWGAFWLTVGIAGVGLLLRATVGQGNWHGLFGSLPFVFFYTFFGRAFEFIVGMWLAQQWCQHRLPRSRHATFGGLLLIMICVFWQTSVTRFTTTSINLFWSEVVAYNYVLPLGIGLFFMGLMHRNSIIHNVLAHPVMQSLGRSSYAFYLIHIGIMASGLRKLGVTNHWLLFGLLVLIAYGLYVLVEKPLQAMLRASPSTP
ncbi:acyltransferase family protein [Spirosoma jeollabukense]